MNINVSHLRLENDLWQKRPTSEGARNFHRSGWHRMFPTESTGRLKKNPKVSSTDSPRIGRCKSVGRRRYSSNAARDIGSGNSMFTARVS